ncbi:MAG: hypothetical protein JRL30_07050 [Deltaproteobacteria bacterium]|nr:hypothetical protein [Deltaproteobacteria bacterium]
MKRLFITSLLMVLLAVLSVPATAKVKIGGIIFTDFYYIERDKHNANDLGLGDGNSSYSATAIQVPNITRLYARWTNEDNVGMYVELGLGQDSGDVEDSTDDAVELRHAYAWWDVNPMFQIIAGKTTTPFSPLNPSQLLGTRSGTFNIIGAGYGDFYSGRPVQVRGTFRFNRNIRLAIALVDPNGEADKVGEYYPWSSNNYQSNTKIPRIDIGLPIYAGPVQIYPSFLYQHRTVDRLGTWPGGTDNSLNSYVGSLGVKTGFGPFGIAAEGNWGKNWGNTYGLIGYSYPAVYSSAMIGENGRIHNAETYSFWFDLSYRLGPVTPHVIYGEMSTKNRFLVIDVETKSRMFGFSVPIDLAKGFRIRPEVMWYDDGDIKYKFGGRGISEPIGKYAIYGVQFQITF